MCVTDSAGLPIKIELTSFAARKTEIMAVRTQVFQREQQIDPALDFDGLDQAATHAVAFSKAKPVGTARVRQLDVSAKIERVGVLLTYRNQGIGRAMMLEILSHLGPGTEVILNAQRSSEHFYQRLGFAPQGVAFMEAGIEHIQMHQTLTVHKIQR